MSVDMKVPEIRFKGFSGEWVENDLGGLIDIRSAARIHKEQWTEAGVPFFRTSDVVSFYKGKPNTKAYISQEVYQELSEKIGKVTKGDLLITGGGSIGIPYLITNDDPLYFKDADLLWLKNNQKFDGYFLYTFFFSAPFKKHIKSISHIGTIAHYTIEQAKATPINTCDEKEQTQIGNTFQKLDSLINQHQQKHDKLSSIKKAMLENMFAKQGETTPEIRFKGFSGVWEEKALGDYTIFRRGSFPQPYGNKEWYGGEGSMPFVQVVDVSKELSLVEDTKQKISLKAQPLSVFVPKGSVVVTLQGTIGRVAVTQYDSFFDRTILIFQSFSKNTDSYFWAYTIQNKFDLEKKRAPGGTIKTITKDALSSFEVLIPSIEEQTQIGNYFQKLDALINQHQHQITKLNNVKQACLNKMFV
jgi:type I restriction enzyme S subunit